jgi:phosphoribosyl 1,2-cyclic phosphodiesterase
MGRLTVRVLGSAAGGGFPQWNCRRPVCALAWARDARVRPRTQSGITVSCPYRKSAPHVLMVESTKHRPHFDTPLALNGPSNGRMLP